MSSTIAITCYVNDDKDLIASIASRRTAQGHTVLLWPDGEITWRLGTYIKGSPRARGPEQVARALVAGWLVMGDVELYDDDEVPALVAAARWAAERDGLPGTMRARLRDAERPVLRPHWVTLEADRDGRPRLQVWRLPRLAWPGLAVWRENGRYELVSQIGRTDSYSSTGIAFRNLRELGAHLETIRVTR